MLLLPFLIKAQLTIDSFITQQNIVQDTLPQGSVLNFNVKVLYPLPTPFTGTIYLLAGVDSSAGLTSIDTVGSMPVINLSNDSLNIPFTDTLLPQNGYKLGGNIVVVWPVASGLINPIDSFRTNIYVILPVGLNENKEQFSKVSVYPNPLNSELTIKKLSSDLEIKYVRIYNLNGEVIYHEYYQQNIDVSGFSRGTYFLELELENRQRLKFKIIK
tara:strand:- start:235 stop:879 length:645 start_codon:yes stop_codon:yes gene_type:complete